MVSNESHYSICCTDWCRTQATPCPPSPGSRSRLNRCVAFWAKWSEALACMLRCIWTCQIAEQALKSLVLHSHFSAGCLGPKCQATSNAAGQHLFCGCAELRDDIEPAVGGLEPTFTTPNGPEAFLNLWGKSMQRKAQRLQSQRGSSKALDVGNRGSHSCGNLEQPSIKPLRVHTASTTHITSAAAHTRENR